MAGPITITCPTCGESFPVPTEVVGTDHANNRVLVSMDRSGLYGHMQACAESKAAAMARHPAGKALEPVRGAAPSPELVGRIHRMLEMRAYVSTAGSRACVMCGTTGAGCLELLTRARDMTTVAAQDRACCPPCSEGNTHPAPQQSASCAEWATEHGAKA